MKKIKYLAAAMALLTATPALSSYEINSEFKLHVSETLFDSVINDFWNASQGTQAIPIPNFTIAPMGIPVQISGIQANLNYSFSKPTRTTTPGVREWSLASHNIAASITVAQISGTQVIERVIDGNVIRIRVEAECHNVELVLPAGKASVAATIRAEVLENQVKLSMPAFAANWQTGAWQIKSMSCTGVEGLAQIVSSEALKALSSFQSFDGEVRAGLNAQFAKWSHEASVILMSDHELPTGKNYVKAYYEPNRATDTSGGLLLAGELRFVYPYVSKGRNVVQNFKLLASDEAKLKTAKNPLILLPFGTVRALMMGEYFSGSLEHTIKSTEIAAFTKLMQSRFKQFFGWPALMSFPKNTTFLFQFSPYGPPSFENEKNGSNYAINGDMTLPLSVRMFAPNSKGVYQPFVEFRSNLQGVANLSMDNSGKGNLQLTTDKIDLTYGYAASYLKANPNTSTRISVSSMSSSIKDSLSAQGFSLSLPEFVVGSSLKLKPQKWYLMDGNLRVDFTTAQ